MSYKNAAKKFAPVPQKAGQIGRDLARTRAGVDGRGAGAGAGRGGAGAGAGAGARTGAGISPFGGEPRRRETIRAGSLTPCSYRRFTIRANFGHGFIHEGLTLCGREILVALPDCFNTSPSVIRF